MTIASDLEWRTGFDWNVELKGADPASGAKPVVHAHAAEEVNVDVADDGAFADIDTPEDYERFIRPTLSRATETRTHGE